MKLRVCFALILLYCLPGAADAQITRLGDTFLLWNAPTRGSATAYDPRNGVYLAVSAQGTVFARFVNADGVPLGAPFVVQGVVAYGQFPNVAYSPDANGGNGAFLVSWHESDGPAPSVHVRLVSYTSGLISPDTRVTGNDTFWEVHGAPVAYATGSRLFFVVFRTLGGDLIGVRINNSGQPISAGGVAATGNWEGNPSITYNPGTDEFFVVYSVGFAAMGQRISASSGGLVGGASPLGSSAAVYLTSVAYNAATGQYLASWHQNPPDAIYGRVVNGDGSPASNVIALSSRFGTYDSLHLARNEVSGTTFLVGQDHFSSEDGGAEIDSGGNPMSAGATVTAAGGTGNFYPRGAASSSRKEWLILAANSFTKTVAQRIQSGSTGVVQPPPAQSAPRMYADSPANGSTVYGQFSIAGWAVDLGATSGTGIAAVHAWAFPTSGGSSPIFLGAASLGASRPDVAAYFGRADFVPSGFNLSATLGPGTYDVRVSALSTVTGTFNNAVFTRITVSAPVSIPRMNVDGPSQNQTVTQFFAVYGWAIDAGSYVDSGVNAVHVYAYPIAGGNPLWVGAASLGAYRPDVAAAFGSGRFANSGFGLMGTLPPGDYNLVVFAQSSVSGSFNQAFVVRIRVV